MRWVVCCPFVDRDSYQRMWATMHPDLQARAVVIDNTEKNLGAAGSRNVVARFMLGEGVDWIVDVSPATRFGPSGGQDFVGMLETYADALVVQSSAPVNWHLMGWHRRLFETVGLFDENFWPIYGEDADMSYRVHVAQREDPELGRWECVDVDAWVTRYGHSAKFVRWDMNKLWGYYIKKWGGRSGAEKFTRPFGSEPLDYWPTPPDPRALKHRGQR